MKIWSKALMRDVEIPDAHAARSDVFSFEDIVRKEVEAERERCARIAHQYMCRDFKTCTCGVEIAAAIRSGK